MSNRTIRFSSPKSDSAEPWRAPSSRRRSGPRKLPSGRFEFGEPGTGAPPTSRDGGDCLLLADDPTVKLLLEWQGRSRSSVVSCETGIPSHGRRSRRCPRGDLRARERLLRRSSSSPRRLQLVPGLSRAIVVLGRRRLVALTRQPAQLLLERPGVVIASSSSSAEPRTCPGRQVDRLVGQEAVADKQSDSSAAATIASSEIGQWKASYRSFNPWRISSPFSSTVSSRTKTGWKRRSSAGFTLDVPAILIERRRADDVKLTTGQGRLEHVRRVHGALGDPGPDHRMHLVDEEDQVLPAAHTSSITVFSRSSNSPRYFVPAIIGEVERDRAFSASVSSTSSLTIR